MFISKDSFATSFWFGISITYVFFSTLLHFTWWGCSLVSIEMYFSSIKVTFKRINNYFLFHILRRDYERKVDAKNCAFDIQNGCLMIEGCQGIEEEKKLKTTLKSVETEIERCRKTLANRFCITFRARNFEVAWRIQFQVCGCNIHRPSDMCRVHICYARLRCYECAHVKVNSIKWFIARPHHIQPYGMDLGLSHYLYLYYRSCVSISFA